MNILQGVLLLTAIISAAGWANATCRIIHRKNNVITGAQELPPDFDPFGTMQSIYTELKAVCPSGIEKCECMNAPGTYTNGPFDPSEDLLGVLLTIAGCGPGKL